MEINLKKLGEQAIESTTGSKKMRLSENATSMVFQLFTKNVYSNPIGTVVREITSNCFDSHVEAKVNSPVIIRKSFDKTTNTHYISFIDFGVGMSPDRIENIYGVYFESTKRVDNTQIGGFGIGGKTPLAYKRSTGFSEGEYDNSFYVITNFDGIRYYYCIYEGQESPVISLLHQEVTTERNGTEVKVPVLEKDLNTFAKEMVKQLYYFENVIFEGFEGVANESTLTNEYQIVRGKNFLFRGNEYNTYMHVCLGRVAYPLNFDVLGLSQYDLEFPIAIRLEVGEIGVTVSRESLDYSEKTIKILKKKIEAIKTELSEMLTKQYDNIVSLEDYFKVKNKFGHVYFPNGKSINVGKIITMKDVDFSNFKYSFLKMPTDMQLFRFFFDCKLHGKKLGKRRRRWSDDDDSTEGFKGSYDAIVERKTPLYYVEGKYERKLIKQAYLKHQHTRYYMISKRNLADKMLFGTVSDLFKVVDDIVDANGKPTAHTLSLMKLQDEFFEIIINYATDYDMVIVPDQFVEDRKKAKLSSEIRNSTIPVRIVSGGKYRIKLDELFKLNIRIFYGTQNEENLLKSACSMYKILFGNDNVVTYYDEYRNKFEFGKVGVLFIQVAQNNVQYMSYCKKATHISEFKKVMLKRKEKDVLEYFQVQNFIDKYNQLDKIYRSTAFKNLSPDWADKIEKVGKYVNKVNTKGNDWSRNRSYIGNYFNLSNIKTTNVQDQYIKTIEEGLVMQELNKEVMQYIDVPYDLSNAPAIYWEILRKVMVF